MTGSAGRNHSPRGLIFSSASDRWHDMVGLAQTLAEHCSAREAADLIPAAGNSALESGELASRDFCVFCMLSTSLTGPQEEKLLAFVRDGGGFVGIHTATCVKSPGYTEMIGGEFLEHALFGGMSVAIRDHEHPVTRDMRDFAIEDELYSCRCAPDIHVLATSSFKGKEESMVWTKSYGKGRVCYVALGHNSKAYLNPNFLELAARAIGWVTGRAGV